MTLGSTITVTEQDTPLQLSDSAANEPSQPKRLRQSVAEAVDHYFKQLDGQPASNVYDLVLNEIEAPLLEAVMQYTRDNQTKASEVLGLNRGTLRKKLKQYGLL
ncbi:MAG: DNA-binding transcriptional regulator Fis [Halopseudomonas sp.]